MTKDVLRRLIEFLIDRRRGYILPNYFLGHWECDILVLSEEGFLTEYEIKVSRADYKKEYSKEHSKWNRKEKRSELFNKHIELVNGKRVNKFYFVTPPGLLTKEEIPPYAGLIEIDPNSKFGHKTIKHARWLCKNKIGENILKDILSKFYYRYMFQYYLPKLQKVLRKKKTQPKTTSPI